MTAILAGAGPARAYSWMIRHDYTGCGQCHADPSGGGLLTLYGRAQGEVLLRSRYRAKEEEPGRQALFLFGAFDLPEILLLGGDFRGMMLDVQPEGAPSVSRFIFMQSDLAAQLDIDGVRLNASIGYANEGALAASLTHSPDHNLISREHWLGVDLGADRQFLLRGGRFALPFGVRFLEHTLWVRQATRTDRNAEQQYGVAFGGTVEGLRGEVMAILGNLEVSPADFREYGYSGYLEWSVGNHAAVGLSSLVGYDKDDVVLLTSLWRQAHGAFARLCFWRPLVILAESDLLVTSQPPGKTKIGAVGALQADLEPWQGLHVIATAELSEQPPTDLAFSYGFWGSLAWFFAPHLDLRGDAIWQSMAIGAMRTSATTFLGQVHLFL